LDFDGEQAAFRVTREQLEWLRSASIEARVEAGLSEWLRQVAVHLIIFG
jgi:hypothetical protein